jgi:hypothetical protein
MINSKLIIPFKIVLFSLLIGFSNFASAQLLTDKEEIINEYGKNYTSGVTDDSKCNYISYSKKILRDAKGAFEQIKIMYLINLSGKEVCTSWRILEPVSQTNFNVRYYKANLVEIEPMKWKDYERNIIYTIEVSDYFCVIEASLDLNNK